jgi:hypothetical protein
MKGESNVFKLKDIGNFEFLPEIAVHIYEGNVDELLQALERGWDINEEIVLSKHISLRSIEIAIIANKFDVVQFLVNQGVELDFLHDSAFLLAVRYGKEQLIRYVVGHGAKLDLRNHVGSGAYTEAYYGNKSNIPIIHELGLDITEHGGELWRMAVSDHDMKTIQLLLKYGVDMNYNKPNMVYPYGATALTVAARNGNFKMVKFLVEHGADVTYKEKDGDRAYTIALSQKNHEMAQFLKEHEPEEFHNLENKWIELKSYKLPKELIQFLQSDQLRIECEDNNCAIQYIEFYSLIDTIPMKLGRKKALRLSADIDSYDFEIVWIPSKKRIGFYDPEHQEHRDICSFSEFLDNPFDYLNKVIDGEFD